MRDDQAERLIQVLQQIRDRLPAPPPKPEPNRFMFAYPIGSGEVAEPWQVAAAKGFLSGTSYYSDQSLTSFGPLAREWAQEIIDHAPESVVPPGDDQ